ncbi:MAG: class I SAM-dependent methyltransferase [Lachnospiraceae bacterium]|nr:class I SAM-dependent methyltransferase [Lachnospiraceae bacterium]
MEAYTDFASLYDEFMKETPYEEWCEMISSNLKEYGIKDGLVCELGAGTGKMTRLLRDKGFDMIGVDSSEEMLMIAREKEGANTDILYLCQDMREFELYGTVKAVVSVCDCINYLLEDEDVIQTFKLANNYLDPKGIFYFDFNTKYKYKNVIGDATIAENLEDKAFIWDNFYDEETSINQYDITFFTKEKDSELFKRFSETHLQRGYTLNEMKKFIKKAGLEFVKAFDVDTNGEVTNKSERIAVIARESGK